MKFSLFRVFFFNCKNKNKNKDSNLNFTNYAGYTHI